MPVRSRRNSQVHPRMCGVLCRRERAFARADGSSPHVRGFVIEILPDSGPNGFIPACAGFCETSPRAVLKGEVHPRMCGVLGIEKVQYQAAMGSSPHVRGFAQENRMQTKNPRFIPACAGFCVQVLHKIALIKVHPRMCGVLPRAVTVDCGLMGSSPHVRGFACRWPLPFGFQGFIPACAGFWRPEPLVNFPVGVHPRMCGVLPRCGAISR